VAEGNKGIAKRYFLSLQMETETGVIVMEVGDKGAFKALIDIFSDFLLLKPQLEMYRKKILSLGFAARLLMYFTTMVFELMVPESS
jgi:hypothetical protein